MAMQDRTEELRGPELENAILSDKSLIEEALTGFQEIEEGKNTVVTVDDLLESLANGTPII